MVKNCDLGLEMLFTIRTSPPANNIQIFMFLVQKKRLEVNMGEKWNLLSIIVNIGKSRQYCLNENINDSLFIKWDELERVLSDITKPRLPPSFWISTWVDFDHLLGNVYSRTRYNFISGLFIHFVVYKFRILVRNIYLESSNCLET